MEIGIINDEHVLDQGYKIKKCGHMFCGEHLEELYGRCPDKNCNVTFKYDQINIGEELEEFPNKKPLFAKGWRYAEYLKYDKFDCLIYIKKKGI